VRRKEHDQRHADERAAADRGQPEDRAEHEAHRDGGDPRAGRELERLALACGEMTEQERSHEHRYRDDHERAGDEGEQHLVEVLPVRVVQAIDQHHAEQRAREASEGQPLRHGHIDRALAQVLPAAGRLGDSPVGEVGAHRHCRLNPQHDYQQRGHQRPAADPRQADENADPQPEQHDHGIDPEHCLRPLLPSPKASG